MAPLDFSGLTPVAEDSPAGENLELDPEFGALERAAQGKPEVQYGDTIEAAVPPDWKEAAAIAEGLTQRTHDLRVMVHLAIARLHLDGFVGYARVVHTIRQMLEDEWAHVHPQLDPEDDNDPMQRSNAVLRLQDPTLVLRTMRDMPLAKPPRGARPIAWRDIAILSGTLEAEAGREKVTEAEVFAAFRDTDQTRLSAVREGVETLVADVPAIATAFDTQAGPATGPDYDPLKKLLREIQGYLVRFEPSADLAGDDAPADAAAGAEDGAPSGSGGERRGGGRAYASITAITSLGRRDEALHALDLAASYFRSNEPSSPLPLLIDRAKRLAGMEFMDILRDLAPDGLTQAQTVAGSTGE